MKPLKILWLTALSFCLLDSAGAQQFVNLNFEQANVPATPAGTWGSFVDPALAFPGWTVLPNGTTYGTSVFYNDLSLGGPAITLIGPDFPNRPGYAPLEGSYSVLLQYFGVGNPPTLSQTGFVPYGTQSISILGAPVIELNGVNIPLIATSDGRAAGDISMFAGQTVQLTITTPKPFGYYGTILDYFDDIQFSPIAVPEPSMSSLIVVCILFFLAGVRRSYQQ